MFLPSVPEIVHHITSQDISAYCITDFPQSGVMKLIITDKLTTSEESTG